MDVRAAEIIYNIRLSQREAKALIAFLSMADMSQSGLNDREMSVARQLETELRRAIVQTGTV